MLSGAGAVDGGVVGGLGTPRACGADMLAGVEPALEGQPARRGRPPAGEGQDLERTAFRSPRGGLADESVADPGVDGPPGGVGGAAEAGPGEVAERDGAMDADVGECAAAPFAEGDGPALDLHGVCPAVAVPHAVHCAAWWRGGAQVPVDGAVEHLEGCVGFSQRPGPKLRNGIGSSRRRSR